MTFRKIGDRHGDFVIKRHVKIPELKCELFEIEHHPSGAEVLHISNDDPENVFCLSFRTHPMKSDGVAHILEHMVLCGSKKYPVKDPFFMMQRRSMNTFMNAFTGSDFTCYPAASQIPKDFYNLLEVYLDAVFHPNLHKFSFLQEGHRLEFADGNDPKTPLEYKGIVFNEMKGSLSSPHARLIEVLQEQLYPNITYGVNSGGNPKDIPKLKYEDLLSFHRQYYHPSQCLFFFYGNIPLVKHLDFLKEHILSDVDRHPPLDKIPLTKRHDSPIMITRSYPLLEEEEEDRSLIALGWLTCPIHDQETILALEVLITVLMDTDASLLKMPLLQSGLCKQASTYVDTDNSEIPVSFILTGCNGDDAEKISQLIQEQLRKISEEDIEEKLIESAIHQLEFYSSEITGDSYPFGLSLFMRSGLLKQHGVPPEAGLKIHSLCNKLLKRLKKEPHYLQKLLKEYFLENPHQTRVVLNPDPKLAAEEIETEKQALDQIRKKLSEEEIKELVKQAQGLIQFQKVQSHQSPDILPKIKLEEVSRQIRQYDLIKEKVGRIETFHHAAFTNQILYAEMNYPLPYMELEDLPYLRLYTILSTQIGLGGRNYQETLEAIQAHTGELSTSLGLHFQVSDYNEYLPFISFFGKALYRNVEKLFGLLKDLITAPDFKDLARIREVILKQYTSLATRLTSNALRYALSQSASMIFPSSWVMDQWSGLSYFRFLRSLVENLENELPKLSERLDDLQRKLSCLDRADLIITCDETMYQKVKDESFYGIQDLSGRSYKSWINPTEKIAIGAKAFVIPSPVAFNAVTMESISYLHPDAPFLSLATQLFDNLVLHTRLREHGGAYGGGASFHALSGSFSFYSYRDPNISSSVEAFRYSVNEILNGNFIDDHLEEAKLEILQGMDSPIAPGSRGHVAYSWHKEGKTNEARQQFRNRLMNASKQDVIEAVHEHIASKINEAPLVVFGGNDLIKKENYPQLEIFNV